MSIRHAIPLILFSLIILALTVFTAGCQGVQLNSTYQTQLDDGRADADRAAAAAAAGQLSPAQANALIASFAAILDQLDDASNGVATPAATPPATPPATAPTTPASTTPAGSPGS